MNRIFAAIPIPPDVSQRLSWLRANLPNARWVAAEDYHLTLRFIGDCDRPTYAHLVSALDQISCPVFDLQLDSLGSFGHGKPRAIWMGVTEQPFLTNLRAQIDSAARLAGIEPDGRKFTPHVTLARLSKTREHAVAQAFEEMSSPVIAPFAVETFSLYSSGRSRGGGPYLVEETFKLETSTH